MVLKRSTKVTIKKASKEISADAMQAMHHTDDIALTYYLNFSWETQRTASCCGDKGRACPEGGWWCGGGRTFGPIVVVVLGELVQLLQRQAGGGGTHVGHHLPAVGASLRHARHLVLALQQ